MFLITCIFILLLYANYCSSQSCSSFNNVDMLLYDKYGGKFNKTVNGCITRIYFGNTTVVKAFVKDQSIPKLGKDSVKHMKYLTIVSYNNCAVEEISPVAFRNVPNLKTIEITFAKLKLVPKGIFSCNLTPALETLRLHHNNIHFVEDQAFYNLSNLKTVELNDNNLSVWRREWFAESNSLRKINFSFNHLNEIPSKAFLNLDKLQIIDFDYNYITKIQQDAFKGIRMLTYLGLSHNMLTRIDHTAFPNTLRIDYFKINANFLTFLSNEVLKKLAAVKITMDFNPWTCPCLERINYWLYIKNGKIKVLDECNINDIPICIVPKETENCLEKFDHEAMLRYIDSVKAVNASTLIPLSCFSL